MSVAVTAAVISCGSNPRMVWHPGTRLNMLEFWPLASVLVSQTYE